MNGPAVLVTGAARRIGRAIAERFGREGWHVVVHYHRSRDDAEAVAAALPSAETLGFDLADSAAIEACARYLAARLPDWRALVCSASPFEPDTPLSPDATVMDAALAANLRGNALLAAAFLREARAAKGRSIVTLLDQKLANPNPDFYGYTASKVALGAATTMLAMALEGSRDRAMALAPGITLPSHDQTDAEFAAAATLNLLGRRTTASEVADAAYTLATGPFANGTTLFVDSGQHLLRQPRDVMYAVREGAGT